MKKGPPVQSEPSSSPEVAAVAAAAAASTATARPIRVVLVDDHKLFRTGVRAELDEAAHGTVEIVGEAADAPTAVAVIVERRPDVVLLDVHLPGGGGVEVLRQCLLTGGGPGKAADTRFLALSVSDAAEDVIGVIRAGARGYVTKSISGTRPPHRPRTRGPPPDRTRLRLQGDRPRARHLGQDRRDPRLLGPPQAAALEQVRALAVG
jgi:CheY-like chemotaxis protein